MNSAEYPQSVALHEAAERVLATGVSSGMRRKATPVPLYFERGDGPYFFDVDGHKLLDYTLAWGPLIVGSNHPHLNATISEQLARSYTFGAQHRLEIEIAETMTRLVPGMEQVIFSNTGSEAVQAAVRIARAYTGRNKILKFEGHYHGWMNNVLVSYHPAGGEATQTQPSCGGQPASEYADTIVLPWNDVAALEALMSARGSEIACILTEPLLSNSGCCEPRDGFLQAVVALASQHGAVSIFDEVITGFRIAIGGAREYFGVVPDLSTYGKAIAGGLSLSAVGGRAAIFDCLRDGRTFHAGTYNGNSICLAAAQATLSILSRAGVFPAMQEHGRGVKAALRTAAEQNKLKLAISGADTVFSLHWGLDEPPRNYRESLQADGNLRQKFQLTMLQEGIYLLPDGRWYVGATHGPEAMSLVTKAIASGVKAIAG